MLKENIVILRNQDQGLAAQILQVPGMTLSIQTAKSGMPTALVNSRYLHSAYDPVREADRWAEQRIKDCQPGETIVVLGVGLLYHVQALRRMLPNDHVMMVVVPDLSELADCFAVRSLEGWGDRVMWLAGSMADVAEQVTRKAKRIRVLSYDPAASVHRDAHEFFHVQLRDRLAQHLSGALHIMVVGPIYGGSLPVARYAVNALEALGHRVSWVDHSPHYAGYQNLETIRDNRLRLTVQQRLSDTLGVVSLAHVAEDPRILFWPCRKLPCRWPCWSKCVERRC